MLMGVSEAFDLANEAATYLRSQLGEEKIDIALVLGSGWSSGADALGEKVGELELGDVPGFSKPVVSGHGGKLLLVRTEGGKLAAIFTGRTHYYEGRGVAPVAHGVRTAKAGAPRPWCSPTAAAA